MIDWQNSMTHSIRTMLIIMMCCLTLAACDLSGGTDKAAENVAPLVLTWDDLVPSDWTMDHLIEEYNTSDISDDDPRAEELMQRIVDFMNDAPVVEEFDGKRVRIPGFVVPLELTARHIQEFLLVPYFGACIHSPPPPANQTIYAVTPEDKAYQGRLYDTVWITGTMSIERTTNELGHSGYRIDVTEVAPYQ